ncbi:MAG: hypothetical protein NZZ41_05350, partial [Candidatus Dojkabacteria bacterium]|nr:hypothetical protein [Candidatus Dojkabacteria bacterium]
MDTRKKLLNEIKEIVRKGDNKSKKELDEKLNLYFEISRDIYDIINLKDSVKRLKNNLLKDFVIKKANIFYEKRKILDNIVKALEKAYKTRGVISKSRGRPLERER